MSIPGKTYAQLLAVAAILVIAPTLYVTLAETNPPVAETAVTTAAVPQPLTQLAVENEPETALETDIELDGLLTQLTGALLDARALLNQTQVEPTNTEVDEPPAEDRSLLREVNQLRKQLFSLMDETSEDQRDVRDGITESGTLNSPTVSDTLTLSQTTVPAETGDTFYNLSGDIYWDGTQLNATSAAPLFTDGGDITYLESLTDTLAIGTSTDIATSTGLAVYNKNIEIIGGGLDATGASSLATTTINGSLTVTSSTTVKISTPVKVGQLDFGPSNNWYDIAIQNDFAYIVGNFEDLQVVDISDPSNLTVVSTVEISSGENSAGYGIEVSGNYAYIVSAYPGDDFEVFDISDPSNPVKISGLEAATGSINDIFVSGNYAYVVSESTDDDLEIFNISDPANVFKVGGVNLTTAANGIVVRGNYAYVSLDWQGGDEIEIINISDPTNPFKVGGEDASSNGYEIALSGNFAYIVSPVGLDVFDVSDPSSPVNVATVVTGSQAESIVVDGIYAYVGIINNDQPVRIYDISDPSNPIQVAFLSTDSSTNSLEISGNYLYAVSDFYLDDLEVFEIGGFTAPTAEIGTILSNKIESHYLRVTQALSADSLNVNTDALIGGSLTITGTASSSLMSGNTNPALTIASGYVGIGTTTPEYELQVLGDVYASSFIDDGVTIGAPDFVFDDPAYIQLTLEEIEAFTTASSHLPWLTPADTGPMALGDRINEILEGLENLFLRVFDLNRKDTELEARVEYLEGVIEDITGEPVPEYAPESSAESEPAETTEKTTEPEAVDETEEESESIDQTEAENDTATPTSTSTEQTSSTEETETTATSTHTTATDLADEPVIEDTASTTEITIEEEVEEPVEPTENEIADEVQTEEEEEVPEGAEVDEVAELVVAEETETLEE